MTSEWNNQYCPIKNRTLFSLSFCLDTKERKNQFSIEDVRLKFLIDRYTKRVISWAYQTTSACRYRIRFKIFFILSLPIETKKNKSTFRAIFITFIYFLSGTNVIFNCYERWADYARIPFQLYFFFKIKKNKQSIMEAKKIPK